MKTEVKLVKEPKDYSLDIDKAIDQAIIEMEPFLEQTAQTNHRYNNRTGNLMRATKVDISKHTAKAYVDDRIAKYGKYIHDGFKKWQPDKFINNAVESNKTKIKEAFIKTINRNIGV